MPALAVSSPGRGITIPGPAWLWALLAGVAVGVSFAPLMWWPLALLGVAGLTLVTRGSSGRRALGLGFLFGVGMFGSSISWVYVVAGWWVPVLLVAALSLYTAGLAWLLAKVQVLPAWPLWAASAWVLFEFGYSRFPLGGFGWTRLAFSTPDQPLSGYLGLIGVSGTSWMVALVGSLLAGAVLGNLGASASALKQRVAAVLLALGVVGGGALGGFTPALPIVGEPVQVGVVQGDVTGSAGPDAMGYARSVTNNHLSETITLMARARSGADPMPDFVLWPENSTDIDPTKDAETAALIEQAAELAGRPIFVGSVMQGPGPGERQTTGLWWDNVTQQPTARYDKRNLVPFGEYIPFRAVLLPIMPILEQVGAQSVAGTEPGVLDVSLADGRELRIGDVICFELAYDQTVYDTVRNGAQLVVVQSNNATYTGTGQPQQQFQITRVRAMEMRREIVVATTSSYSGYIDPSGKVLDRTEEATSAARSYTAPLREGVSLGVLVAPIWELVAALVGLIAAVVGARAQRAARGRV